MPYNSIDLPTLSDHDISRFRRNIDTSEVGTTCHLWKLGKTSKGYGHFWAQRRTLLAHRVAYALANPNFDTAKHILHKCDNPKCVNPDHLFSGSAAENISDMVGKNRHVKGERQRSAKLTAEHVRAIRASSLNQSELARAYGVSQAAIWFILNHKTWKHIQSTTEHQPA